MKIFWHSNAPWSPTGYGNQTEQFLWRLNALEGHEVVAASSFWGLQGAPLMASGIRIMPGGADPYGNDTLLADSQHFGADVVITLMDVWVLNPELTARIKWCPWVPIDHDPVPPAVVHHLKTALLPIAMSKWGQEKLAEEGIRATYVPHGINTKVFKPGDRKQARADLGLPNDVFVAGIVSANKGTPSRKCFDQQIRAFAIFHERHPDSMLYLHTDMMGMIGEDIGRIIQLNKLPKNAIATVSAYKYGRGLLGPDYMASMYNALDVLMNASKGGGFEIPIVEAQACGTPVITTNFSAMPELVFAGSTVGWSDKFFSQESYQVVPDVDEMVNALELAYSAKDNFWVRDQARRGALNYDADVVVERYWKPALAEIEGMIEAGSERQLNRAERRRLAREKRRAS